MAEVKWMRLRKPWGLSLTCQHSLSHTLWHTAALCCLLPRWTFVAFLCPEVICGCSPHLTCRWSCISSSLFQKTSCAPVIMSYFHVGLTCYNTLSYYYNGRLVCVFLCPTIPRRSHIAPIPSKLAPKVFRGPTFACEVCYCFLLLFISFMRNLECGTFFMEMHICYLQALAKTVQKLSLKLIR